MFYITWNIIEFYAENINILSMAEAKTCSPQILEITLLAIYHLQPINMTSCLIKEVLKVCMLKLNKKCVMFCIAIIQTCSWSFKDIY